ncbi:MAG: hypothetical protein IJZ42_02025 [Lachnospiraceae bacterium]|nr:hypothetical protein [Lachnospiraceae bacterium]
MISEQRVKLMTRLAAYEQKEGQKNEEIGSYFRDDYISFQLLKSIIYATVAFLLIVGLFVLYDSELFMSDIYKIDILEYAKKLLIYYLGFTGVYVLISYIVYAIRYRKAKKRLRVYFNNLKRLQILYQRERKEKMQ